MQYFPFFTEPVCYNGAEKIIRENFI